MQKRLESVMKSPKKRIPVLGASDTHRGMEMRQEKRQLRNWSGVYLNPHKSIVEPIRQ